MYATSTAYQAAIIQSHKLATLCEVYVNGMLNSTLTIIDGNVNVQDTVIRRNATISLTDPTGTLTPASAGDLLAPNGNEFKLYRGLYLPLTGVAELIPVGIFGIKDIQIQDSGDGFIIQIQGDDRAAKVQRAKFSQEYVVAADTNYATAIQTLIANRYPTATFNFTPTAITTPLIIGKTGDDPWALARNMAAAIGCDLYFDVNGICVLTSVPLLNSGSVTVWTYAEGANSTLLYANRRLTYDGVFSHVVVSGENNSTTTPVKAEAFDTNPLSPTYYLGKFGDVVDTSLLGSKLITTVGQAQTAANARLQKVTGFPDLVQVTIIPNAAHEVGDVVQITRAKSKINNKYLLDKFQVPMTQDRAMSVTSRQGVLAS